MTLSEKTCVITGANSGLGLAVSKRLAEQGANAILLCRNKEKGEKAILEIKREIPGASTELMICDLASMKSIQSFIEEFKKKDAKLDILYNNAAVMKQKRTVTEDGFEMMFQVNYLAPFTLMNSLLDSLKKGTSPMIINNGRPTYKVRLDFEDLQFKNKYSMYKSFFETKLCLLFANLELSRRQERDDIAVTMIDPGPFKSELVRDLPLMGWFKNLISASVDKAAENILYHVTSDDTLNKNGKVFKEKKEWPLSEYWQDRSVSGRLWEITESFINKKNQTDPF